MGVWGLQATVKHEHVLNVLQVFSVELKQCFLFFFPAECQFHCDKNLHFHRQFPCSLTFCDLQNRSLSPCLLSNRQYLIWLSPLFYSATALDDELIPVSLDIICVVQSMYSLWTFSACWPQPKPIEMTECGPCSPDVMSLMGLTAPAHTPANDRWALMYLSFHSCGLWL